ncbi:hypothetical protein Lal_00027030 [Lupinus albus]|nr:hypothetical protein Lal_00027030 [Lupinus albus]
MIWDTVCDNRFGPSSPLIFSSLQRRNKIGVKRKEESSDLSKSDNEDMSKLLTGMPSTMQGTEWNNNSAAEVSNVQSSGVTTDDNFGLENKPIASLFPLTNTTNHNENQGYYSWDNLPGLC